jgi:hypothetical protein
MLPRETAALPVAVAVAEAAADDDELLELLHAARKALKAPAAATEAPPRSRFLRERPSSMRSVDLFILILLIILLRIAS